MAARNALSDDCATTTPGAIASEASATVRKRKRMTRSGDGADAGAATLDAPSHGSRQLITTGPPDYEGCARRYPLSTRYPVPGTTYSQLDRKSTRLNSSHVEISYAVFCLK